MLLKYLRNLIVSVFCTLFLLRYIPQMGHADILTASGVISTVSGILFGFILATISIFSAASENSNGIIKALKNNNILQVIIVNLLTAGASLITACVIALIAMFANEKTLLHGEKIEFILIIESLSLRIISVITFAFTWRKVNWILPHI